MADKSEIENALVTLIAGILYPNGSSNPTIVTGYPSRIYRGSPNSAQLDIDLLNNVSHVTVIEQPGFTRVEQGYLDPPTDTQGITTLTISGTGPTVTLGGTPGAGQLVGVAINNVAYAYALTGADTLATAATSLAALVAGAVAVGPVITFATNAPVLARTTATGTSQSRPRWQAQGFRVTVWAPSPAARDTIVSYLDAHIAATYFINLPDGQGARLEYRNTFSDDVPQKELLWKRDLYYTVTYATSLTVSAAQMLFETTSISPATSTFNTTTQPGTLLGATVSIVG